jgi:hypothetical protein
MEADTYFLLCQPFPIEDIEVLPGATNSAKDKALAMPYADMRAYQRRLDLVVGALNWQVSYRPWGENAVICSLTISGITREDVGEEKATDPNCRTSAVAQAFKRTCSSFGLGRYLYDLPTVWAPFDSIGKRFRDPAGTVKEIYSKAGLLKVDTPQTQKVAPPPLKKPLVDTDGRMQFLQALQVEFKAKGLKPSDWPNRPESVKSWKDFNLDQLIALKEWADKEPQNF